MERTHSVADKQTVYVDDDGMPFPKGPQYAGSRPCTMDDLRRNAFACFGMCHNLNFLLVTKRPENVPDHLARLALVQSSTGQTCG